MTEEAVSSYLQMHGSAVAWDGQAVLVLGASGAGKSSLALQLMAYGATLVSDDRVDLLAESGKVVASAPARISGMIEARGIGILRAAHVLHATVALVVDLDQMQTDRFPETRQITILGCRLPLLFRSDTPHFPAGILQYLKMGPSP